jgi:metal-responsive CopG/Arc/MetJ family transcriptional regulator
MAGSEAKRRPDPVEKVRIHVVLPAAMVRDIERYARSRGISRSAAVATLLPHHIGRTEEEGSG